MEQIKVIQIGMGPLGIKTVQFMAERQGIAVIGAVDVDSALVGRDLGEVCALEPMGIAISDSVAACLESLGDQRPDAAILTTVSDMERIAPQIEEIVAHKLPVVSTCEELLHPWNIVPELAARIDKAAQANQVAVVGTGVNPGFLMDSLPTFLTAGCQDVQKITVNRFQNAAFRRIPFQKKIGAGLSPEQFEAKKQTGTLRHVGLAESIHLIAASLGWQLSKTEDILSPVIAKEEIVTEAMTIPAGYAAGVEQIGKGYVDDEQRITLNFRASVGEPESLDSVEIEGNPHIKSVIPAGVHGDVATCAIAINAVKQILNARPGLRTMADMPMVSFFK